MTKAPIELLRPAIRQLKGYQPAIIGEGSLRLHANENRLRENRVALYPDQNVQTLYDRIQTVMDFEKDSFLITRGSDDGIDLLCRSFLEAGQDAILTCPPTFSMYALSARIQGADVFECPVAEDGVLEIEKIQNSLKANPEIKLIFLCNPQNPYGTVTDRDALISFANDNNDKIIVLDEAYIEYSEQQSMVDTVTTEPNIIVLRTLSKAWGLAGARLGVLVAHPDLIQSMRPVLPPFALSTPSIDAALSVLSPAGLARTKNEIETTKVARDKLLNALDALPSIEKIWPSQTNFLSVRVADADAFTANMRQKGIIVRNMDAILPRTVRITVGSDSDNALLLNALGADTNLTVDRTGREERTTKETSIFADVNLDKSAPINIETGIGFFDHMLEQLAKHSGISMTIKATGDTHIDAHHTVEDCMLTLGSALKRAIGDKRGIGRYGFALPMDEVRAEALLDLSGRAVSRIEGTFESPMLGDLPTEMIPHAFQSLAANLEAAIHIKFDGENDHHKAEGAFKALAKCLKQAVKRDGNDLPTTKGAL